MTNKISATSSFEHFINPYIIYLNIRVYKDSTTWQQRSYIFKTLALCVLFFVKYLLDIIKLQRKRKHILGNSVTYIDSFECLVKYSKVYKFILGGGDKVMRGEYV